MTASSLALQKLIEARRDFEQRHSKFDVDRFKPQFVALTAAEARVVEQSVILELHEIQKLLSLGTYPESDRKSCAEAFVYFTGLYDWGQDERLIDQTLSFGLEAWGYERVFKDMIRKSMASIAPDEHKRLFAYQEIGREARALEEAATARLWRRIGFGFVVVLAAIAVLAKWLSP